MIRWVSQYLTRRTLLRRGLLAGSAALAAGHAARATAGVEQAGPGDTTGHHGSINGANRTIDEVEFLVFATNGEIEIAPGIFFPAWSYSGRVPGPALHSLRRCRYAPLHYALPRHPFGTHGRRPGMRPPIISVKHHGAVGDGVVDDTNAIRAAVAAAVAAGGKRVFFPRGSYKVTGKITATGAWGLVLEGDGPGTTIFNYIATNGEPVIEFLGCIWSGVRDLRIYNYASATGGFGVSFDKSAVMGCYRCFADHVRIEKTYHGIQVKSSTECRLSAIELRDMRGNAGVHFTGTASAGAYRLSIDDLSCDAVDPGNTTISWVIMDSYSYSLVLDKVALINGGIGVHMLDSANTGTSYPIWLYGWDVECDHSYVGGVVLDHGEGVFLEGSWFGSCLTGNGVVVQPTHRGEVTIATSRIYGNAQHGVLIGAGPLYVQIVNNQIGDNGVQTYATSSGITVNDNCTDFVISGNNSANLVGVIGNSQQYGIYIGTGCTDYVVTNNYLKQNVTAPLANGSSATGQKLVENNFPAQIKFRGTVTIAVGATSASVAHSLGTTPNHYYASPVNDGGYRFFVTVSATHITVNLTAAALNAQTFQVFAEVY